ncbi:MAG: radical SAM protein [Kiritimatiellae bacterium]|nr:radical SAM protein [Kiritimatiellia bacterium]
MQYRYTKQGVHLFNRASGTNILIDEMLCNDEILSVAPANVSIALTNRCNRSCVHCFAPKNVAELDHTMVCDWIDELNKNGCLGVGFGGGEPLLYPHLCEICQHVYSATSMACTLTTNGDYLNDETVQWMKRYVNFVRISTNGETMDYSRIENLARHLQIGINYLLNAQTFPMLMDAIERSAQIGVKEFLLLPQVRTKRCQGVDSQFVAMVDDWLLSTKLPLRVTVSALCSDSMKAVVPIPGDVGARQYLHISADGILRISSFGTDGVPIKKNGIIQAIKEVYQK